MVTEQRNGTRDRDTRNGDGVAARFRPLRSAGGDAPADPAPPEFATAPWGYRRAEVDAWASWVAGIVAQARAETVRADSAEATLRATLDRLERLEESGAAVDGDRTDTGDCGGLPRRTNRGPSIRGATARWSLSGPDIEAVREPAPEPSAGATAPEPPPSQIPADDPTDPAPESTTARLRIVESTLQEVMQLLNRLATPERPSPARSPAGS